MRYFLLACCGLLSYSALVQRPKLRVLYQYSPPVIAKLADGFDPQQLLRLYRADFTLRAIEPNPADATLQDSMLQVDTRLDRFELRKSPGYVELQKASITSARLSFGGMRIGTTQADFCRRLHLSPAYDAYSFLRMGELPEQITCIFANGQLRRVEFERPTNASKFR